MNAHNQNHKWHPVTWIVIVIGIIGVLLAIAIPSFVKSRNTACQRACINNLRMIDSGRRQAELASNIWQDLSGTYVVHRIKTGYMINHTSVFDETQLHPAGNVTIVQKGSSNLLVTYQTIYNTQRTNLITYGTATSLWCWTNASLVYEEKYAGSGFRPLPGSGKCSLRCVISKQANGSLGIISESTVGGKLFWAIAWTNDADKSEIELIPCGNTAK